MWAGQGGGACSGARSRGGARKRGRGSGRLGAVASSSPTCAEPPSRAHRPCALPGASSRPGRAPRSRPPNQRALRLPRGRLSPAPLPAGGAGSGPLPRGRNRSAPSSPPRLWGGPLPTPVSSEGGAGAPARGCSPAETSRAGDNGAGSGAGTLVPPFKQSATRGTPAREEAPCFGVPAPAPLALPSAGLLPLCSFNPLSTSLRFKFRPPALLLRPISLPG